jgi:hypothetical protein
MLKLKEIVLKKLESNLWEYKTDKYIYEISKEDGIFIVDLFNSKIKSVKKSYIKSDEVDNLKDAKKYILDMENKSITK